MKTKIEDLYFGICEIDQNSNRLVQRNLFDNLRVKQSIAIYRKMTPEEREKLVSNPVYFCFGDTNGRVEYEMRIAPEVFKEGMLVKESEKTDIYKMYVLPNSEYLMSLVDSIDEKTAKKWLKENKR